MEFDINTSEMIGVYEIAKIAGVTASAIANWRKRFEDFPKPIKVLKAGPVFSESQIKSWLGRKGKIMGVNIISTINLKGGVAKTTTTVGLAQILSGTFNKKVLVIDLDPQTNATTMLIGEDRWEELNKNGNTLATLFKDAIEQTQNFNLEKTLQKNVSNIDDVKHVDLLPSSIDLIDLQDRLITMPAGKFYANKPIEILMKEVRNIQDNYDYILIDCPPNLGLITLNGLRISSGYIIPTIPDVLSTYGIPQIISRVNEFSKDIGAHIQPIGILATKVRGQSSLHMRTVEELRKEKDAHFFSTIFYENNQMGEAAEYINVSTLRQKWGYQGQYIRFEEFANEILTEYNDNE
ncbi:MAG: AAA family ATPase [Sphaerochaeta sp.]|nr:AAA family ATPase [Sphaerochaeta sp.]